MIIILLFLIFIILIYNFYIHYGKNGRLINRIPGPPGYPIFGHALQFICSREKQWNIMIAYIDKYYPIFKLWAFFRPVVFLCHPDDLKTILNSTNHIEKSMFYDFIRPAMGGIFTNRGAKWQSQRKKLNPAFNFNLLQQFVEIFLEQSENMTKSLKNMTKSLQNTESTVIEDLESFVGEFTLNIICETAMGISLQDLGSNNIEKRFIGYLNYLYIALRPWMYNEWLFSLTEKGREQKKILEIIHRFSEHVIAERKLYHERTNDQFLKNFNATSAQSDDTETSGVQKKRFALLDLLIAVSREGLLSDLDIRQEVDTFIIAGHDTVAKTLSFLLALLAEHKDIQDRVRNEVDIVMQENGGLFTIKSLKNLTYLKRCIKESMRLYPIGFQISRVTGEDVKLQSYSISAGTILILHIYKIHRDPNFWPNPEVFDPDRFLPERIHNQYPYSYIPFSAGPRNCIGQQYGMLEMQAMTAILIHNFYLEPVDNLKNLRLQADMLLSPTEPLRVRFVPIFNK